MDQPLRVTIVGAGLAGLLAARVLRERHTVTLVEKFKGGHEVGAAINLGPNGVRIIEQLGFNQTRCQSVKCGETRTLNKAGELISTASMTHLKDTYGAEWIFQHRADLWIEFLRLAEGPSAELGVSGEPAKILWGQEVVKVDVESGEVVLASGQTLESDLVVGADGIKSIVRPLVVAEEAFRTARPSGSSAFRFTIPRKVLDEQQPGLRVIDPTKPGALEIHLSMDGSTRSVIMYPCREYELLNVGCITPDAVLQTATTESWSAEGSKEDLLRCFSDFSPSVLKVLDSAEYIKVWQLRDQDPLPSYRRGRVVLVGDAAHSMTPHQGQGCNQAIEDAEGFRLFNQPGVSRDSISDLLTDFDRVRRPRASKIQNYTRQAHHKASAQDLWKYTDYNYTYPGILECLRRLNLGKEMIRARQYPDGLHA
ncbi:hypothetical protein N7509_000319 [Penicillium cosmopolitanum]|uniref:FAD-binding domain-containing protein n=1 Tax=Penicillium cosmopolitanum TaxID=1131564 RepID=A0A9W9WAC7_9EURO|nr:uncharacterized protein N7509_000319 [Penicillium cosmopolitanum]KAJ5413692.1 hypothetical protein N7509_000319 [Penicillium cosmopolitanum]